MSSLTKHNLSATFTVGSKDSSGNFTISGTITNNASSGSYLRSRLTCSLDNSSGWQYIGNVTLGHGESVTGSTTFSTGNTLSQTVYIYLTYDSNVGNGGGYTVEGYVDPTPPTPSMSAPTLSVTTTGTPQIMGQPVYISESGGSGYTVTARTVSGGGTSTSFGIGNWTIPTEDFEPYCLTSNTMTLSFVTSCTAASGYQGSGNSNTVSITARVPNDYLPTATHDYTIIEPRNSSLVANYSSLRITLYPEMTPADNSASISSCVLYSVSSTNSAITTSTFTQTSGSYVWTSSTLPTLAGSPSYTFSLTFRITDSRGNVLDYTTETYRVTNFIPPYCSITNLKRDTATTATLNVDIDSPSAYHLATVKVGDDGTAVDVTSRLVTKTGGYTLEYPITGLSSGNQYTVYFTYQDTNMYNYGELPYTYTQLLSTLQMPLSLYDDGTRSYVSYGEEAQDDYTGASSDVVVNFAKGSELRATNNTTTVYVDAYDLVNSIGAVDDLREEIETDILLDKHLVICTQSAYEALSTKDSTAIYLTYEE